MSEESQPPPWRIDPELVGNHGLVTVDTGQDIEIAPAGTAEQQPPERCTCNTCPHCGKPR